MNTIFIVHSIDFLFLPFFSLYLSFGILILRVLFSLPFSPSVCLFVSFSVTLLIDLPKHSFHVCGWLAGSVMIVRLTTSRGTFSVPATIHEKFPASCSIPFGCRKCTETSSTSANRINKFHLKITSTAAELILFGWFCNVYKMWNGINWTSRIEKNSTESNIANIKSRAEPAQLKLNQWLQKIAGNQRENIDQNYQVMQISIPNIVNSRGICVGKFSDRINSKTFCSPFVYFWCLSSIQQRLKFFVIKNAKDKPANKQTNEEKPIAIPIPSQTIHGVSGYFRYVTTLCICDTKCKRNEIK